MPQRQFWTERHATGIAWAYTCQPTAPEAPGSLSVIVYDQSHAPMERRSVQVVPELTYETVHHALLASWSGYLFGEEDSAGNELRRIATEYRRAARRAGLL